MCLDHYRSRISNSFFNGKRLKGEWTKKRQIPTAGTVMHQVSNAEITTIPRLSKDPKKALTDRRYIVSKLITKMTLAEHAAIKVGDAEGAAHARMRWHKLHSARYLMSPFADAYRSSDLQVRHANKSRFLLALKRDGAAVDDGSRVQTEAGEAAENGIFFYYDFVMPNYSAVMIDLMNHIWTRGTDGRRGNSIFQVTVMKLKHLLRPWFTGRRSKKLAQLHLHIDDPTLVIPQKRGEQGRRDGMRHPEDTSTEFTDNSSDGDVEQMVFHVPITIPWSSVIGSRSKRDAICSLHLFCAAVAGLELAEEGGLDVSVFLYGGCFCFQPSCVGKMAGKLLPELATLSEECLEPRAGEIMLSHASSVCVAKGPNGSIGNIGNIEGGHAESEIAGEGRCPQGSERNECAGTGILEGLRSELDPSWRPLRYPQSNGREQIELLRIPRTRVLKLNRTHGLEVSMDRMAHGEAETRFVAAFKRFVEPHLQRTGLLNAGDARRVFANDVNSSACVVVSKDTDVMIILALAKSMHGRRVVHVLGENVIDIDVLVQNITKRGMSLQAFASSYVLAGCDYTPGTYGVLHEHYLRAALRHASIISGTGIATGIPESEHKAASLETATLLAYVEKHGLITVLKPAEKQRLEQIWLSESCDAIEIRKRCRQMFVSEYDVGSLEWELDVRRFVSERAKSVFELVPPQEHVRLQSSRTQLIVSQYWSNADRNELTTAFVGGCKTAQGFDSSGRILLEKLEDVKSIQDEMQELVAKCCCRGQCSNRQCSCVKRQVKCVGCECEQRNCKNKVTETVVSMTEDESRTESLEEGAENVDDGTEGRVDLMELDFISMPPINSELDVEDLLNTFDTD